MAALDIFMNGSLIGEFIKTTTGANEFSYYESWLNTSGARTSVICRVDDVSV
jgi:serine/threonine-protein kinase HipA